MCNAMADVTAMYTVANVIALTMADVIAIFVWWMGESTLELMCFVIK